LRRLFKLVRDARHSRPPGPTAKNKERRGRAGIGARKRRRSSDGYGHDNRSPLAQQQREALLEKSSNAIVNYFRLIASLPPSRPKYFDWNKPQIETRSKKENDPRGPGAQKNKGAKQC
jgi:hypothetical protein